MVLMFQFLYIKRKTPTGDGNACRPDSGTITNKKYKRKDPDRGRKPVAGVSNGIVKVNIKEKTPIGDGNFRLML